MATPALANESSWGLVRHRDDIEIYARDIPDSRIKEFKVSAVIRTPIDGLMALFNDTNSYCAWMVDCMAARLLRRINLRERITYLQTNVAFLGGRDIVVYSRVSQDPKTRAVTIRLEGAPDLIPSQPGFLRIRHLRGSWQFVPLGNGLARIIYQLYVIPGGKLNNLSFVVNSRLEQQLYETLVKLRERLKRL